MQARVILHAQWTQKRTVRITMRSSARTNQKQNQNQNQNMENNYNECPCCHQDWVADTDRNCPTCDLPVSEHVSVEVLCKIMRRTQERRDRERALADRLAEGMRKMVLYSEALISRSQDRSDINFKTLNEGVDLFNEWKEARSE